MANKDGHRRFGNVRKRPSGRWQARYPGPDGRLRFAPETFERKSDALRFLTMVEAQMARDEWVDPQRAKVLLGDYAERWIDERAGLRPRTVALYRWLFGKHVKPYLGGVSLGDLSTALVREWRSNLLRKGVSQSVTAKAYRLLRSILMTAVKEDGILTRNPCCVPGADKEDPAERPVLSLAELFRLADAVPDRFRALVLLTTFASLRYGEAIALRRRDVDLVDGAVHVRQAFSELAEQGMVLGPPKSRAGRRTVAIPKSVISIIRDHLDEYVPNTPDAFIFTGPKGAVIRRGNFNKLIGWPEAVAKIERPGLHFHDLRHTGNTLAARSGASTRDLMARMGHDSVDAAIIYQHASSDADRAIADGLESQLDAGRKTDKKGKKRALKKKRKSDKKGAERNDSRSDPDDDASGAAAAPAV